MNKDVVYIMRKNFTIYYQEFEFLLMTIAMMGEFNKFTYTYELFH